MKSITKTKIKQIKRDINSAIENNEPFDAQLFFKIPSHIKKDLQQYAKETNQTVSDILRYSLQNISIKESKTDEETVRQLNKIGVNLNQVARGVNQSNARNKNVDLNKVAKYLAAFRDELVEINNKLTEK